MSKQIITAETVRAAWKAGQSRIALRPGDIVTQQARDDARQHGISLAEAGTETPTPTPEATPVAQAAPVAEPQIETSTDTPTQARAGLTPEQMVSAVTTQLQEALAPLARALAAPQGYAPGVAPVSSLFAPVSYTPGVNPMAISAVPAASIGPTASLVTVPAAVAAPITPVVAATVAAPAMPVAAVTAPATCVQSESSELAAVTAEIRRRVLAALPEGVTADASLVDQLIKKTLFDTPCTTCSCDACSSKGETSVSETSTPPTGKLPGFEQAGGVMHVSSKAQVWGNGGSKDSVSMMDVLSPTTGAAASVGYLEWDSLSFSWTFERAEVLVVLEGELRLTIQGTTFSGATGDVFSIPKGVEVMLASTGHVKCTTVGSVAA